MDYTISLNPVFDKTLELEIEGWEKLVIMYSVEIHAGISYLCWKVQGTEQVFKIQTSIVYEKHGLNYSEHFSLTLKSFREDYLTWKEQEFKEDWMQRYHKMFHNFIII